MRRILVLLGIGGGLAAVLWGATSINTAGDIVMRGRVVRGTADPPCFDNTNRFVDCDNGTVTDTVTGLVWLADASCATLPGLGGAETGSWSAANSAAARLRDGSCGLSDGSRPGDWRLATKQEWEETIAKAVDLGCDIKWRNDAGTACWISARGSSFRGLALVYWTSTANEYTPSYAWDVNLVACNG